MTDEPDQPEELDELEIALSVLNELYDATQNFFMVKPSGTPIKPPEARKQELFEALQKTEELLHAYGIVEFVERPKPQ
jgi:hypothetical protein